MIATTFWRAAAAVFILSRAIAATPDAAQVNAALGIDLFARESVWEESAAAVAERLRWPMESQTSYDASYRLYPGLGAEIAGSRVYSCNLIANDDKPASVSLVFANKGDIGEVIATDEFGARKIRRTNRDDEAALKRAIEQAEAKLTATLTELFGPPQPMRFGPTLATREKAQRWDWEDQAFVLTVFEEEFVNLRILPTPVADALRDRPERLARADLKARLAARVERRPNGDVIVKDIPMVDQGPKGYCVPATFERFLRYMGIPGDMNVLAMIGGTQAGGGTRVSEMILPVRELARRYGRSVQQERVSMKVRDVGRFIDNGLPIIWGISVIEPLEKEVTLRSRHRPTDEDVTAYLEELKPIRREARKLKPSEAFGHARLITGYNAKTDEIAMSDSWGEWAEERWITVEEAASSRSVPT